MVFQSASDDIIRFYVKTHASARNKNSSGERKNLAAL
jgi:hypothetical protein